MSDHLIAEANRHAKALTDERKMGGRQMSAPTPRTDAASRLVRATENGILVHAAFARTLERELADQTKRFHDEIVRRQETVRNNHELDLKERDHLLGLLAIERARVRVLRKALENVKDSICRNVPDGYSQPCVDESADECDKIIDSAMTEGAK